MANSGCANALYVTLYVHWLYILSIHYHGAAAPVSSEGGGVVFSTVAHNMKLSNSDAKVLRLILAASFPWNRKEHGL